MRLKKVERETHTPDAPLDVVKTLNYHPELFGHAYSSLLHVLLRGDSEWSIGERELLAAFTSQQNKCPF